MHITSSSFDVQNIKNILHVSKLSDACHTMKKFKLFINKGATCNHCGRVGEILVEIHSGNNRFWQLCDKDFVPITIDHIKPKSKGGSNVLDNLQPLCYYCNVIKSDAVNDNIVLIKKIVKIQTIPDAEHIELIYLNGYRTYAEKAKYNVGDRVVFIKPDSWIPQELFPAPCEPKINMGVRGWRLKKKKIMGNTVTGMILPLSILEGINYNKNNLANALNIKPYVIARGKNHIDSIASRHKKLKTEILTNFIDIIDPQVLEIINDAKNKEIEA